MGRRNDREQGIRRGQTIVAERERAESEVERLRIRKRKKRRKRRAIITLSLLIAIGYLVIYTYVRQWSRERVVVEPTEKYVIKAEVVDEDSVGFVSARAEEYIVQLEQDLTNYGFNVVKFVLPSGTSRELYVDVTGVDYYFKVNMDKDAAVTAEDINRMVKYLTEREIRPEYVDVRVDGKAYYK